MKGTFRIFASIIILLLMSFTVNAQIEKNDFIKDFADNACQCIDSIDVAYKSRKIVAKEISKCINKQVSPYQLMDKLMGIKDLDSIDEKADTIKQKRTINIIIGEEGTAQYKEYYYKLEKYLMKNCPSIKTAVASNEKYIELGVSQNDEAVKYYTKGQDAGEEKNYKKAIKYYKKALKIDPNFAFALDNLGLVYRKTQQYDKALEAYAKSIKIIPTNRTPIMNSAVVYTYQKKWDKAIEMYQKLIDIDTSDPESFYGIGHVQMMKGDFESSLDNMCKAYNLYININSPYRTDAEKIINVLYQQLKKEGKEEKFNEILKKNHINTN